MRILGLLLLVPSLALAEPWALGRTPNTPEAREALEALGAGVEGGGDGSLLFDLPASQLPVAQALLPIDLITADTQLLRPEPGERGPGYHSPESAAELLVQLAALHPDIARVVDLGDSILGRDLTGLLVTDQPFVRELDEPAMRILGTHHGDEWSSLEVPLALAEEILDRKDDPAVRSLIDTHELWFLPVVNPDGVAAFTRRNANNVDLNRNYDYQWTPGAAHGPRPFSEPESAAVRALSLRRSFHHSITMHSGSESIGWVWNYVTEPTPEDGWLAAVCARYQDETTLPDFEIQQGADWYLTFGDTNDWSYGVRGGHDYTLELTDDKAPPAEEIPVFVGQHLLPSLDFLLAGAESGLRGRVVDERGAAVEARFISPEAAWPGFSDPETGAFARPLPAGGYSVSFLAEGYQTVTADVVVDGVSTLDVVMPRQTDLEVHSALDLGATVGLPATARVCGGGFDGAVTAASISRPGLRGPFALEAEADGDCVLIQLDSARVEQPELAEGEWTLHLRDAEGQARAMLPLGVLFAAAEPGFELPVVQPEGDELLLVGELPEGAELRLVGPDGARWLTELRGPGRLGVPQALPDGAYALRVFGNGRHAVLPGAFTVEDGVLRDGPTPPTPSEWPDLPPKATPEPEPSPTPEPTEPGGCACRAAPGSPPPLVGILLLGYAARRRRP